MKTKTIGQTIVFRASPEQVYDLLMNSRKHQSLSGLRAKTSKRVGGRFFAWNGHIQGMNLVLKRPVRIVQAWRATGWWPDHYSLAIFDIVKAGPSTKLHFTQIGVPPNRYSGHYRGWIESYWTPMKELLENGSLSSATKGRIRSSMGRIRKKAFRRRISDAG